MYLCFQERALAQTKNGWKFYEHNIYAINQLPKHVPWMHFWFYLGYNFMYCQIVCFGKGWSSLSSTIANGLYVAYFKPSSVFNHVIKSCLGWNDHAKTLVEHVIHCKVLMGKICTLLLKQSSKDARQEHFKVLQVNV